MHRRRIAWLIVLATLITTAGCRNGQPAVLGREDLPSIRPIETVQLALIEFPAPEAPLAGPIELCLTPKLRARQWNVSEHPFRIDLGSRAYPNVERLAKTAFDEVEVSFDSRCGVMSDHPSFDVRIVSANRDRRSEVAEGADQWTAITLSAELSSDDGSLIWSTEFETVSKASPSGAGLLDGALDEAYYVAPPLGAAGPVIIVRDASIKERSEHAAEEFGKALGAGLLRLYEELLSADAVRQAMRTAVPSDAETAKPSSTDAPNR